MTIVAAAAPTLNIGLLALDVPVVLAPMAGITNTAFRRLCREYGAGLYVSEMITSRALVERTPESMRLIRHHESETVRSIQLYGVDPKTVALAAKQHELGGNETVLLRHVPRKLTKGWFTREAGVTRAQSEQVFEAAVASGLVAPDGRIKAAPADYRGAVDKLLAQIDRGLRKPVKSQLLVLYATHAFNGEYAARECEFLLGHL